MQTVFKILIISTLPDIFFTGAYNDQHKHLFLK